MSRLAARKQGRKGAFLSRGRRPAILVSNAPGWGARALTRLGKKSTRIQRTIARMRAAGEEVDL